MGNALPAGDYVQHDATELAAMIARGDVSATEVIATAQALMREMNGELNVAVEQFEQPLAHADDGPFAGVPFVIKDLVCHAEGVLSEAGSRLCKGLRAPADTALMQRWRKAGLATIARVATPEFGYCATTESLATGRSHNPWDLTRSPGGSSGASGASVAAGIVPMAHANDGGGSIRIPAAVNGLVGLKPTRGRVSLGPDMGEALQGMAIEFAVTRTVRDAARLLDAVAGAETGDPFILPPPPVPYAEAIAQPPKGLRVAVMTEAWSGVPVAPEMKEGVEKTAALLESLGHRVEEAMPKLDNAQFMAATHVHWIAFVYYSIRHAEKLTGRKAGPDTLEATTLKCYEEGGKVSAETLLDAISVSNHVTRDFAHFLTGYDILLTPTTATPALPLGTIDASAENVSAREWTEQQFTFAPFTPQFNMTGQPAISLPMHRNDAGLPCGVQCVARHNEEHLLLALAAQLEQADPWPRLAPMATARGG